ncbi:peptide-methionine (R)-S-oxide reductase MsrB [Roseomonas populi]|uniref:peptide-methionine (R)-S-oxide reductase n=1 Tax=Roseomonas populi TaxID=3121582 RepID=A0ABT1WY83_9PROT|nr:peptide-methionine (R)-S-oxide reductase MsrB [Roseomonas pecuniae]MCR0980802.1 peptide-methionine (R)-S-oxide reductase MsrB [Roseomonas pecuniae]
MPTRRLVLSCTAALALPALGASRPARAERFAVNYGDAEWRRRLTPAQYTVLRQSGTEPPFSSPLNDEHRRGTFACAGCGQDLFSSTAKFDSGTGWPSFWTVLDGAADITRDTSHGMVRDAVHCHRCGGHLGHVFEDGPRPTGLRYCMNGVAMAFRPAQA